MRGGERKLWKALSCSDCHLSRGQGQDTATGAGGSGRAGHIQHGAGPWNGLSTAGTLPSK